MVKFLESDPEVRIDPMATIFPRVTKCSYFKYGPSGTVQTHDAICVLVSVKKPYTVTHQVSDNTYSVDFDLGVLPCCLDGVLILPDLQLL